VVRDGETVEVRVGTFTSESPLTPIKARGGLREQIEPFLAGTRAREQPAPHFNEQER
jgi:hypothetical protein